jgi:hypothetical protein
MRVDEARINNPRRGDSRIAPTCHPLRAVKELSFKAQGTEDGIDKKDRIELLEGDMI